MLYVYNSKKTFTFYTVVVTLGGNANGNHSFLASPSH